MDFLRKSVSVRPTWPSLALFSSLGSLLLGMGVVALLLRTRRRKQALARRRGRAGRLVVITGCDSGLGLAMAFWAKDRGYAVVGGVYSAQSQGAALLRQHFGDECHVAQVDVTQRESLQHFRRHCADVLESKKDSLRLWALIPNAAVGLFGEFFWLTEDQGKRLMDVNFWGSVGLTREFRALLLKHRSRVLLISSDCADFPLPGLAIYSATKAALENWADAFRLEVAKYGVTVTSFQPGNFPKQTRLFSGQREAYAEMQSAMSAEERDFYGNFFQQSSHTLLTFLESAATDDLRNDDGFRKAFVALLEDDLRFVALRTRNPPALRLIHALTRILPARASDRLKLRLMGTPPWAPKHYP